MGLGKQLHCFDQVFVQLLLGIQRENMFRCRPKGEKQKMWKFKCDLCDFSANCQGKLTLHVRAIHDFQDFT